MHTARQNETSSHNLYSGTEIAHQGLQVCATPGLQDLKRVSEIHSQNASPGHIQVLVQEGLCSVLSWSSPSTATVIDTTVEHMGDVELEKAAEHWQVKSNALILLLFVWKWRPEMGICTMITDLTAT